MQGAAHRVSRGEEGLGTVRCGGGRGSLFLGLVRRAVRRVVCRPLVGALAFYIVWSLVATYPLILAPTDHIENWGDPLLNVWIMAWDLHQLGRDPLHLFDAPIFYPAHDSLALSELLLAQALQSVPIVALTGNFILAYNLLVIGSYVLCGLGMYLLVREMLPPGPSLVAGAVYAYSFYRVGEFSHLQILSAQWIPLAILMLLRLWRHATWKRSLILAALVVIQALSSFYLGLFLVATLGFVLLLLILTDRRIPLRTLAPRLAGAGIIALAVLLPFSWPYFRVEREFGLSRTLDDAIGGSATPRSYLTVPPTSWLYGRVDLPILQHFPTDETLFPGLVPALLALVGLFTGRQRRWTAFFCALALFGVIMSFGPRFRLWTDRQPGLPLPYLLFYAFVPGFRSIRVVGRIGVIATLGLAGLAATGAAALLARAPARWRGWVSLGLALLVGGETLAIPVRMTPVETPAAIPPVYRWLASLPDTAPVLELPTIEARWLDRPSELERQGHEQYLSIYHWHPTPSGYSGFAPPLFWTTIREARDFPTAESIDFFQCLGLRYIIFHEAQMDPGRWQEVRGRLATFGSVLQPLARFGSDAVYRLADPPRLNQLPEPSIILPSMARAGDAYRFFLDWLSPGPVGRVRERQMLPVYLEWQGATDRIRQDAVAKMPSCLRRGETSVPVDVAAPVTPGRYQLTVATGTAIARAVVEVTTPPVQTASASSPSMQLVGASITTPAVHPGGTVLVRALWRLRHPTLDNYLFRIEVISPQGGVVAAGTIDPFDGALETSRWLPGEIVPLGQAAVLPAGLSPGDYGVRLLVRFADGAPWKMVGPNNQDADSVLIGRVRVD